MDSVPHSCLAMWPLTHLSGSAQPGVRDLHSSKNLTNRQKGVLGTMKCHQQEHTLQALRILSPEAGCFEEPRT